MRKIDVETLRAWLETNRPLLVLDVRPAADRAEWAIPGSIHVDAYDELKKHNPHALDAVDLQDDVPVVTVCGAGHVSQVAAEFLEARGAEVYSLVGGMRAWSLAWNTAELVLPESSAQIVQIRRVGKGCLSYMIGSNGQAAVIDASLQPDVYLDLAQKHGWKITAVLDTHIHADHLSRSRLLAEQSGATLYLPEQKRVTYPFTALGDRSTIQIGNTVLNVLRTPGHTLESTCYLLDQKALFSGDTLFLQGVGRPDLHANADEARTQAHLLYNSLQRLRELPEQTLVLSGHTSLPTPFDEHLLTAPLAKVWAQVKLLHLSETDFVETLMAHLPPLPPNHQRVTELNEAGLLPENVIELEAGANRCAIS
jgi:glyoxylase-like metal-dependent hydrolase (beta-lactamase superfamily II)/rhodanese-related sulfurtransferase